MCKKNNKKVNATIRYIRKLDSPEHKREVYAILMNPRDCLKVWNLLKVPLVPTIVTVYRGYTIIAHDKVEEGTIMVTYKIADLPIDFSNFIPNKLE